MNLPNKLTLIRIILIPVFIFFVYVSTIPHHYLWAAIVFSLASFTDFLDGYLARKYNLITDFGKFADPLADKLLTTTAFIYMMADGVCSPLVIVLILMREFAVSGMRMVAAGAEDGKVIAANVFGKVKTVLQMLSILWFYFAAGFAGLATGEPHLTWVLISTQILCWLVALVTVLSGVQYLWQNRVFIQNAK